MTISARCEKKFSLPITLNTLDIASNNINFINISEAVEKIDIKSSGQKSDNFPVIIQDGHLLAQRFVIDKLDASNLSSDFNLNSDGIFDLSRYAFYLDKGNATGDMSYDIKSTELKGKITTNSMDANALATTFMNIHDEVYGRLDSKSEFSTSGKGLKEMTANANGKCEFEIRDGRLVRLGSLEYLLMAGNTLLSGLGNLSLNKIVNLIIPEKTGSFKVLKGTITAKGGTLYTDDLKSIGKNLSLHLRGSLRMSDDYADMTIFGKLRRRVSGKLGPLGSLSINNLITDIPGIGFIPGEPKEGGIIDFVPFINQIPGLGIGGRLAQRRYRLFVVRIVGNLYDPKSVRSFRWITRKESRRKRGRKNGNGNNQANGNIPSGSTEGQLAP